MVQNHEGLWLFLVYSGVMSYRYPCRTINIYEVTNGDHILIRHMCLGYMLVPMLPHPESCQHGLGVS